MTLEQILLAVVAAGPSIVSIAGIIVSVAKVIKEGKATNQEVITKFEEVRTEIVNTKEYTELKDQLLIVHQENYELKKKLNELLTKIDRINREDE